MPITLRPQDNFGSVLNANTYALEQEFVDYHEERGRDLTQWGTEDFKAALVRAFDYENNSFRYGGQRVRVDQVSAFPRYDLTDIDDNDVYGITYPVKQAQMEYAYEGLVNGDLNPTPTRDGSGARVIQRSESVGPISESYTFASGAVWSLPQYPKADSILKSRGYVVSGAQIIRA